MSSKSLSTDRAKKAIKKLQKEGMSLEQIQAELSPKGISPEITAKLIKDVRREKFFDELTVSVSLLVIGLLMAGFSIGIWLGWFELDFLSYRSVFIVIVGSIVGVIMVFIGIVALIQVLIEANKR